MKSAFVVVAVALALEWARGEWVQVAVIDGKRQPTTPGPQGPPAPPAKAQQPAAPEPAAAPGPPGPNVDDVITIRRTVGDSFSNKQGVVPDVLAGPQSYAVPEAAEYEFDEDHGVGEHGDEAEAQGLSLRVLREAHQTLLRQSAAPVSGKLEFLRRLKNRMLRHIASLMPLSAASLVGGEPTGRSLGADVAQGRGHKGVGFPSNESTLLSLAFLVFAVFLVKVVMQLIYAVQNSQSTTTAGVRVAQMQIPGGGVSNMMGTVMGMVPAMMPPMMAAMNPGMAMGGGMRRARRDAASTAPPAAMDSVVVEEVDRMTSRVLDAIHKARARVEHLGATAD